MDAWRRVLPDFEIKTWTEDTYDIEQSSLTRRAYQEKKYAFVSDYARLDVLRKFGGIYLDVDVEVRKSFAPLLHHGAFLGFMFDCNLGTSVIGAQAQHPLLTSLLAHYEQVADLASPNNDIFTRYFLAHQPGFRLNNSRQEFGDVVIYPKEYFEFPTLFGRGGYSVHYFMGSWWRGHGISEHVKSLVKGIGGRPGYWLLRTITHQRAIRHSPFRVRYLADR
jgi:hypothetical protein